MDDIITTLGVGPWNALYFTVAALSPMSEVVNLVGAEFIAPPISFTCIDPPNDSPLNSNQCLVQILNSSDGGPTNVSCKRFLYDNSTYISTLTSEFNLVCSRDWIRELFQLLFTVGCIVGCPLGGILADRYGRQPPVFYGSLSVTLLTVLMVAVPVLHVLMAARFFIGIFTMIIISPAYTIALEACPLKHRATYGVTVALPYALMLSILAGIAWLSRKWRLIQLWGSVPMLLLVVCSNPYVLKESPRWLVSQGRLQQAEEVVRKAATINNTAYSLPDDLPGTLYAIQTAHSRSDGEEGSVTPECVSLGGRVRSMVSTSIMRRITVITVVVWLFQSTLYISIPLRATNFLSPFAYMAVLGVAEIPAYTITAPITSRTGRKPFVVGSLILTAIMEGILVLLMVTGEGEAWSSVVVSAVAYTFVCSVFQVNLMYCSELFPTSVRTLGTSLAFFMSSTGFNIPPLLDALLPKTLPWLPLVIYSTLACCAASLVLLLPETNKRPLMQTVQKHITYTDEKHKEKL